VGINNQIKDFLAARRLGKSVYHKLNITYGRLVEKCLNCNFGMATKLNNTELQSAILIHIINQLDVCLE
jgi:ribosomal protein L37E